MAGELPRGIAEVVVGRRAELKLLLGALAAGKAVLLVGLPGVSKTTMLRALAGARGGGAPDRLVEVTGDEQLSAHALVGTFDPPMVLKDGYLPEHFVAGPLVRAMRAGGILYVEEVNRAPSGALNALLTALSEGYLEVPRLGRVRAADGFTVVGAANPLDDVGTSRLSRGLADRFVVIELGYQPRDEELEIVARRAGPDRAGFHPFAVDVARESRRHPDLRHGASVRAAIDLVALLAAYRPEELDLDTLRRLGCAAYAGKVRVRAAAGRTACEIVHELMDAVLRRDYRGEVATLLEAALARSPVPAGDPAEADAAEADRADADADPEGAAPLGEGDQARRPQGHQRRRRDELPGLARPGGGGEPGESRSVPMVGRDRPSAPPPGRLAETGQALGEHLRDLDEVLRRARELVLRPRDGRAGQPGGGDPLQHLRGAPWNGAPAGQLDLDATVAALVAGAGHLEPNGLKVLERPPRRRDHVIFVDHSGSMVGRKLELGATLAAVLAQLSAAGRADYAVVAFDEDLEELKPLGEERDVEEVVDRILRLPEGRATDLGKVFRAAAELSERLPDATDVVLVSDCMPTKGVTTYQGLAALARRVPSLYVCFTDERSAAIRMFHGERQLDLYQWWARQWVGEERFEEVGDVEEVERLTRFLGREPDEHGL